MEVRNAAVRASEIATLFELRYPGLVDENLHQGAVMSSGTIPCVPDGPVRIRAPPNLNPLDVIANIANDYEKLEQLAPDVRERVQLASRWFRRNFETDNLIDRFLFLWLVLEIHPGATNSGNLVDPIAKFIGRIYPALPAPMAKRRLELGRLYQTRVEILHRGKAFVRPMEFNEFSIKIDRLETLATLSLKDLLGQRDVSILNRLVGA